MSPWGPADAMSVRKDQSSEVAKESEEVSADSEVQSVLVDPLFIRLAFRKFEESQSFYMLW